MKVVKLSEVPSEAVNTPLFTGGDVSRQTPFAAGRLTNMNFGVVSFGAGARNKMHRHTSDQILIITEGTGVVRPPKRGADRLGGRRHPDPGRRGSLARRARRDADGPHHDSGEGQPDDPDRGVGAAPPSLASVLDRSGVAVSVQGALVAISTARRRPRPGIGRHGTAPGSRRSGPSAPPGRPPSGAARDRAARSGADPAIVRPSDREHVLSSHRRWAVDLFSPILGTPTNRAVASASLAQALLSVAGARC